MIMPITKEQKDKIKKILADYRRDVRTLKKQYKQEVVKAVEELDQVKAKKFKRAIEAL